MKDSLTEKVIVVGKNSYVGRRFTDFATTQGVEVIALGSAECNFLDAEEVYQFFRQLDDVPHTIVFFAVVNKTVENSYQALLDNMQMIRHLMDGCRLANIKSVIYFSSVDVYGAHPGLPITEKSRVNPDTWYGLAKANAEWMLSTSGEMPCPVTILRIPGIYGHADHDRSIIGAMVRRVIQEKKVVIFGDGKTKRDYVWIDDLCCLLWELVPLKHLGVLNIVTGQAHSLNTIVEKLRQVLDIDFEVPHELADTGREFDLIFENKILCSLFPNFQFQDLKVGIKSYLPLTKVM
jgi:UDP-glucose 4-epimerase